MAEMGIVSWAARRQIQALSDSISWSLGYVSNKKNNCNLLSKDLNPLLVKHGFEPIKEENDSWDFHIGTIMQNYIIHKGNFAVRERNAASTNDDASSDFGQKRAGANWCELDNFIITSSLVRLLGSLETFETDMLKAMLYYCPNGIPYKNDFVRKIEERIILEEPEIENGKEIYVLPPIWTWIKTFAYSNVERRKILKNVFKMETNIDGYKNKTIDEYYEMRNSIAHGRKRVELTLKEYCEIEIYVLKSIKHYENECMNKFGLAI